jgi:polyisoprenyl-teichoic acid--peptidoglycan teichoic acid transferase
MRFLNGRRLAVGLVLALATMLVPGSAYTHAPFSLIKLGHADAVGRTQGVTWMLALGSDARVQSGDPVARSRADSIHLVGFNVRTGAGVVLGIPRDSYVAIPGHGSDKINASLVYGGPQLAARTVARLTGIRPDYVFLTGFHGFAEMVHHLGGVEVRPPVPMNDLGYTFPARKQRLNGAETLAFSRIRYGLPRGDFDRSLNQGRVLKAGLHRARQVADVPGRFEALVFAAIPRMETNMRPSELYRLGRVVLGVEPAKVRNCVAAGGTGSAGGASVVLLDRGALARVVRDVRRDATLNRGC